MLKSAQDEVIACTIKNCFAKAGFYCAVDREVEIIETSEDLTPEGLAALLGGVPNEDFLDVDENISPVRRDCFRAS